MKKFNLELPGVQGKARSYWTLGVTRPPRVFFCDIDCKAIDIFRTKDGYHIVAKLAKPFDYILTMRKGARLRIAAKYDKRGRVVNPKPKLVFCTHKKHKDIRLEGRIELYATPVM